MTEAYVYQAAVEVLGQLTPPEARICQCAVEVLVRPTLPPSITNWVFLEVYDTDGTTLLDRSGIPLRTSLVWPLNATASLSVELAAADPVVTSVDVGHVVKLVGPEGVLFVGTIRDIPGVRLLDDSPAFGLEVLTKFDDLNMKSTLRRWWDTPGYSTGGILWELTHSPFPPGYTGPDGLLYGTGWTLDIQTGVGNRVRVAEYLWMPLLRAIVQTIEAAAAAWWADPLTLVLHVGEFGADSGIVVTTPDGPDPLLTRDATVLWATRISKEVQGPLANRIFGIGAELDDDPFRVILPYPGPGWGAYAVVEIAGAMSGQLEYYIQDAASIAAYGLVEYGLVDRDIGIIGVTYAGAQLRLYGLTEAALKRWKDKVNFYTVDCVGNQIDFLGTSTVTPGSKVRLVYQGYVERTHPVTGDSLGVTYETVNELLFVMSIERRWDSRGVETVRLMLADSLQLAPVAMYTGGAGGGGHDWMTRR